MLEKRWNNLRMCYPPGITKSAQLAHEHDGQLAAGTMRYAMPPYVNSAADSIGC